MSMRRLVLLFDGTWNKPESNTNVERLRGLIAPRDTAGVEQVVNYIAGVGVTRGLTHLLGGAFGFGLADNVREGYRWLCDTWRDGDELYLFGFSRGAYTARSLGGMIRKCGLLRAADATADSKREVAAAYDFYRDVEHKPDDPFSIDWRRQRGTAAVGIHFIGVWDTVGALGIPDTAAWFPYSRNRYQFHDTELSRIVKYAYQALALDEHRADFTPALWTRNPYTLQPGESLTSKKTGQIEIEQRWFIGAHADVGGGNEADGAGRKPDPLPDLPLAWLQRKATDCGLACAPFAAATDAWTGVPRDSYGEFMFGLYKHFQAPIDRVLGTTVNEQIDATVWQRWRDDANYRSPSVVRALAQAAAYVGAEKVLVPVTPAAPLPGAPGTA